MTTLRPGRLWSIGLLVFSVAVVVNFRIPILADLGRDLTMGATQIGLLTTAVALGRLAAALPAGRLTDRLGASSVLVLAGAVLAAGSGLLAASADRWQAWTAAALLGLALGLASVAGMTRFSTLTTRQRRGVTMGGFAAAFLGGQAVGPALSGVVAGAGDWRTPLWLGAGIGLVMATVTACRWATNGRGPRPSTPGTPDEGSPSVSWSDLTAFQWWCLAAVPFTQSFAISALPLTILPVIGAKLGLASASIGLALALGGVVRVVGNLGAGVLSDQRSRKMILVPGLIGQAAGVALLAVEGQLWAWLVCIVVMSLFSSSMSTASAMLGDHAEQERVGRRFAAFRVSADTGQLAGAPITAALFAYGGQAVAIVPVATLLLLAAAAVAVLVPETHTAGHLRG